MLLLLFCNIHLKYLDITKQDYSCVQTLRNVTAVTIQTRDIVTIVTRRHSHLRILLRLRIFSILCCSLNLYFSKDIDEPVSKSQSSPIPSPKSPKDKYNLGLSEFGVGLSRK